MRIEIKINDSSAHGEVDDNLVNAGAEFGLHIINEKLILELTKALLEDAMRQERDKEDG